LRGIAILLVRAQHAQIPHMAAAGTVGVTLFFVLSGFLITSILRREHGGNGRINYRSFYGRRARRLLPALALLLVAVVAYVVASRQPFLPVALAAGYGSNIGGAMGVDLGNLQLTWTLSLEEQFYLGWPLLLPLVVRWRPALVLAVAAAVSAALRTGLWLIGATPERVYLGPDTRADAILVGCALVFAITEVSRRHLRAAAAIGAVVLVIACSASSATVFIWSLPPVVVASTTLVAWAVLDSPRFLTWRPLVAIGKISYGLYLWNLPIALSLHSWSAPLWARAVVLLVANFAMAVLSWYIVERPFNRMKGSASSAPQASLHRGEERSMVLGGEPASVAGVVGSSGQ